MVLLLEAAEDSKKTLGESIISILPKIEANISSYITEYKKNKNFIFNILKGIPIFQANPILINKLTKENTDNTYEISKNHFLSKNEIQEFYENGFISKYFKFPFLNEIDLINIQNEYLLYKNYCHYGIFDSVYCKFPDYVGHIYMPSIIKLLDDNYDFIVQKAKSIFNVSEEELFFSVGVFLLMKIIKESIYIKIIVTIF